MGIIQMNERRSLRSFRWIWISLGLLGSGFVLYWGTNSYHSPVYASLEESNGDDLSTLPPGVSTAITEPDTVGQGGAPAEKKAEKRIEQRKPPLGQITVLVPERKFKKEGPRKAVRVGFDDIDIELVMNTKELSMELPKALPDWLKHLNGQRIRLRGFMHSASAYQTEGIKRFIFCRDTKDCCFGPDPTIYYLIEATMKSGTSINYIESKPFDLEGVFRIDPVIDEKSGKIPNFYYLDEAQLVRR
jgi:hypothetical protein